MEVKKLIELVAEGWEFTQYRYPELANASHIDKRAKSIKHVLEHIGIENGDLFRSVERHFHNGHISDGELRIATLKIIKDVLRLADLVGVTADEIIKHCEPKANDPG